MSRSNLTAHGMIQRIEIDYESYPISRAELSSRILWHYKTLLRDRYKPDELFLEVYDEKIGAPFAWPELHFANSANLN